MIKYCKSCGKEYKGDWCENCGYGKPDIQIKAFDKYKVEKPERFMTEEELAEKSRRHAESEKERKLEEASRAKESRAAQKKSSQWSFIIMAAAVFAAIVLFVLYQNGIIFKGADKSDTIKDYFYSIAEKDFDKYISTMIEPMAEEYRKELDSQGLSKTDFMTQSYSDYSQIFGDGFSISKLTQGKETKMSSEEIKSSQQIIKEAFGKSYSIKEAYRVAVEVTYSGPVSSSTMNYYVYVGKINRKWYILNIEG